MRARSSALVSVDPPLLVPPSLSSLTGRGLQPHPLRQASAVMYYRSMNGFRPVSSVSPPFPTLAQIDGLMRDFPRIKERVAKWVDGEIGPVVSDRDAVPGAANSSSATTSPGDNAGASPACGSPSQAHGPLLRRREGRGGVGDEAAVIRANGSRTPQAAGGEAKKLDFRPRDRLTVASALLHGADVSSPGRPWETCRVWVARLLEEFQHQAEQVGSAG